MNTTTSSTAFPLAGTAPMPSAPAQFALPLPVERQALAQGWLALALLALVGSGLFSVLLVLARTPVVNAWLPGTDFFRTALVVHVDLSVLVWFVAIAGLLWSSQMRTRHEGIGWGALALAGAGAGMMALAPFADPGTPVMANYIPVLESRLFLAGLGLFGLGTLLLVLPALVSPLRRDRLDGAHALRFGLQAAAIATAVALGAFAWSLAVVPRALDSRAYWEIVFWGGGHALQFAWTLLMLIGWLWLAHAAGARVPLSARIALGLFGIALAGVAGTPAAYLLHDVLSPAHRALNTWGMRVGGGLAILPVALAVAIALLRQRAITPEARPLRAALVASMGLFAAGGLIGLAINGSNVRIPAHYHGCIVGVTLALMGLVFHLLPRLGGQAPRGRLAVMQPLLYGAGQLMHIIGLVWSGGYGVQRKVAGAEQVLRTPGEVFGMGLMGLGGAVAIAGGLLFVVVVLRAWRAPAK
ncbi:cbb3-type cytochrome c oxidase subunit I [Aquabacterium humicola]|uniref:cbb3-type cytochrome c oxidase subunit I n=1 Tax=Aquabacterium humicola TaxID=3237377 RepID=UPI002542ADC3|nr:cbb3-type cytochrome c oxidase subunit I [Rubrivivax pictus]